MNRLFATAAALPLLIAAHAASAQTSISTATTAPVRTSTAASGAPSDVTVTTAGSIRPTAPGAAITIDSDNDVINQGTLGFTGVNDATGILLLGGFTGSARNEGTISLVEDYTPTDTDSDGDIDGPFAQGANRYGIRLTGPAAFTGDVTHVLGGSITIEGNNSAGISLESALIGSLRSAGAITVTGDNVVGVRAVDVSGLVSVTGAVTVQGAGATGVSLGEVDGRVSLQNAITSTGYRNTARSSDKATRDKLDADDLLQGGSAVRIAGSVGGGIILDRPPTDSSTTDTDEDDDGVTDSQESTAVIRTFGAAPALDIGGAGATTIGVLGTGDLAYGLLLRGGQVSAAGVFDGVTATGVRVGQAGGGATTIDGGIRLLDGSIDASAFEADAVGLLLNAGASTPIVTSNGRISAASQSEAARGATAVLLEAGASLPLLRNDGDITALVQGEAGTATAVLDRSGTLARLENTGVISASVQATDDSLDTDDADTDPSNETVTGAAIAIDLRASTLGATLVQTGVNDGDDGADGLADADTDGDGVDNADEPAIIGDVLLGSGADRLELLNGALTGAVAFGAGADALVIDGGAVLSGVLSDADGALTIDVGAGRLDLRGSARTAVSSLSVGDDGALSFTIDGDTGGVSGLTVNGAATLETGAQVDLRFANLIKEPSSFVVIDAQTLTVGALDASFEETPFLYNVALRTDAAAADLIVDVRRRTAAEIGFNASETAAYDAVFENLDVDPDVEAAFLARTDRDSFIALYDQLLPDHSGGSLMSAAAISSAISSAVNAQTGDTATPGATGVWAQQIFFDVQQDRDQALGYEANGFGFAAGIEEVTPGDSAYGVNVSFVATEYNDQGSAVGEQVSMNFGELGVYGRVNRGGLRLDARAGVGFVQFDSDRRVVSLADSLSLTSTADWNGWLVDAHLGAAYEQPLGFAYVRPQLGLDYVRLHESEYEEDGAGDGIDLSVDSRSGDLMSGVASVAFGARFGRTFRWGPELTLGWRQRLAGDVGETTARFAGGPDFTLTGENPYDGGALARFALKGAGERTYIALEAGAEVDDDYQQFDIRAVIRFTF